MLGTNGKPELHIWTGAVNEYLDGVLADVVDVASYRTEHHDAFSLKLLVLNGSFQYLEDIGDERTGAEEFGSSDRKCSPAVLLPHDLESSSYPVSSDVGPRRFLGR